tara:strand:- start:49092 stop:49652 length:561 start_codon:yes stop_codon:yes gene_type:complete
MPKYSIIYADPPWDYKGQTQHSGKGGKPSGGAASHYSPMKLKELKKLPVKSICEEDCLMFMWVTSPHLDQGIELMKSWGFSYATIAFVWDKVRVNPGFYTMSQCEVCIVGKMGKIPKPRGARNVRQYIRALRGKHSKKPYEARERISKMFPTQPKIELFARKEYQGWDSWGNEVKGVDIFIQDPSE